MHDAEAVSSYVHVGDVHVVEIAVVHMLLATQANTCCITRNTPHVFMTHVDMDVFSTVPNSGSMDMGN